MRIDGLGRMIGGSAATRPGAARGGFSLSDSGDASPTRQTSSLRAAPALDALLALQAVEDASPRDRKRKALARGRGLLDALDGMKLALVDGREDAGALSRLAARLREANAATGETGLDDALSAIELRAAVELAKRGG